MATGDVALKTEQPRAAAGHSGEVVNDFSIQVATVNGSGSQSANNVLLSSIFAMGIPVSGKNLFPSNIAGLPTWYTIRASKHGYVARKKDIDILVAMNAETAKDDILSLPAGGMVIYEDSANLKQFRDDVTCYPVPFDKITAAVCPEAKLRKLVKNMIYVGVVAQLLDMDMAAVETAVRRQFAKKQKAADLNWVGVQAGYNYAAKASLTKQDPFRVERMHANEGKIIIDGNAALRARLHVRRRHGRNVVSDHAFVVGCRTTDRLPQEVSQSSRDGKATFAVVQAEDELAAVGMVLGAGMGRRALDDRDLRPRHLAHGRVRRARLLCRNSRRHLRYPARRALDRLADAHRAGRSALDRLSLAWRHQATSCCSRLS